jgi:hypothetical protein
MRLSSWVAANGVGFINTLPAMQAARLEKELYSPLDGHCTPAGYVQIAEEISTYLTVKELVP